ncbi:glycosyltransferase [Serratia symbiotica str. 'Cinara cedri']|nr:glycosyltransferase [Serratia symbiotica str. 'Cinara cedri']
MIIDRKILSIILIAHNCESYLDKTLATLHCALGGLDQGYEIILISDSSIDRTVEICQQFTKRHANHTLLFQVDFCNIGKARNFGVRQCSGDYVTMVDGDDLLLVNSLFDVIQFLVASQPELLLTKLNEVRSNNNLDILWTGLRPQVLSQHQAIKKFLIHKDIQAHFIGQFIKRELLLAYPFPPFYCYEDAYLFPTILSHCQHIVFSCRSPYLYFKHSNSLSSSIHSEKLKLLIQATEEMERVLSHRYTNLISCHWINILLRYHQNIDSEPILQTVIKKIKAISSMSFFLDPNIRLSFKKKYFKIKNEK